MVRNPSTARPARTVSTGRQLQGPSAPGAHRSEGKNLDVVQRYLNYVVAKDAGGPSSETPHDHRTGRAASDLIPERAPVPSLVRDVMTREVISVPDTASLKQVVAELTNHRVAALPVVDSHRAVVGVVSESDLLAGVAAGVLGAPHGHSHGRPHSGLRQVRGTTARELMTTPAITTTPDTAIAAAARDAAHRRVRRLPVVDGSGRLVGIVSRGDLLRTFLRSDKDIRQQILDRIIGLRMGLDPTTLSVGVQDGVVSLAGTIESQAVMETLLHQIGQVGGVVGIRNDLTV